MSTSNLSASMDKLQIGQRLRVKLHQVTYEGILKNCIKEHQMLVLEQAQNVQTKAKFQNALILSLRQVVKLAILRKPGTSQIDTELPSTSVPEPEHETETAEAEDNDSSDNSSEISEDLEKKPLRVPDNRIVVPATEKVKLKKQWQQVLLITKLGKHYEQAINNVRYIDAFVLMFERSPGWSTQQPPPLTIACANAVYMFDLRALGKAYEDLKEIIEAPMPNKVIFGREQLLELYKTFGIKLLQGYDMQLMVAAEAARMNLVDMLHSQFRLPENFLETKSPIQHEQLLCLAKRASLLLKLFFHITDESLKEVYACSKEYSQKFANVTCRADLLSAICNAQAKDDLAFKYKKKN